MPRFRTFIPIGREARLDVDGPVKALALTSRGEVAALVQPETAGGAAELQIERFSLTGSPRGAPEGLGPSAVLDGAGVAYAALAPLAGGGLAAAWGRAFSHSVDPLYAVFDGAGDLVRGGSASGVGLAPAAVPLGLTGGGFAVAVAAGDLFGQFAAIELTRYAADGIALGAPLTLAAQQSPEGGLFYNNLQAVEADGGMGLLWTDREGVHAGLAAPDGGFQSRLLDAGPADDLDVAVLADGRLVATWAEPSADLVQAVAFDLSDFVLGAGQPPATLAVGSSSAPLGDFEPEVVALRGGGFAISWRDGDPAGHTSARAWGPAGEATPVFHAFGDFLGVDSRGWVITSRTDAAGEVWIGRELARTGPVWIPGLDRIPLGQATLPLALQDEWLL